MEPSPFASHDDGSLSAAVDLRVYGQDALLKAAHHFTDRCHLHLQTRDPETILVRFRAKDGKENTLRDVAGEFFNELLDQRLRALVQRESEPVRNLILAHEHSRTSLLDQRSSEDMPGDGSASGNPAAGVPANSNLAPTPETGRRNQENTA